MWSAVRVLWEWFMPGSIFAWPEHFFEDVIGGWQGGLLVRPSQGVYKELDL
jgi:hypothetical protein